ncbi:MAG: T9SS type A sorting domain-containing protein [Ignavibacteriales bacterium]|nr:T9SS type A sorting domain-containing protein [Ignavibacteriales bacterium]
MRKIITILLFCIGVTYSQVWDSYTTSASLTYTQNNAARWSVVTDTYRGATGGVSSLDYSSTDITTKQSSWDLNKANGNSWTAWMSTSRTTVSGWASGSYSFAYVLAANNSDFTNATCAGYALVFQNTGDVLALVRFSSGIGTTFESNYTNIVATTYVVSASAGTVSTNGVNVFVSYDSDGKWTVKWLSGAKMSESTVSVTTNYTTGSVTSGAADETFTGTSYKYCGWIWNHSTSASAYSYWDNLGFGMNGVLPVELSNFGSKIISGKVNLNWSTATEINNVGFNVQRSSDKLNWKNLGFVEGAGNSNSTRHYSFIDNNAQVGTYYYRLKQTDNDGSVKFYNAIEVKVNTPDNFSLNQNYPNPFNPGTTISYAVPMDTKVELNVYSLTGQLVKTLVNQVQTAGYYSVPFNAGDLSSGLYIYQLRAGGILQTRKMTLVK